MVTEAGSATPGRFLDLNTDVKGWLQYPVSDITKDVALQLIVDMACTWVQNQLGGPVLPTRCDRRFDGGSGWTGAHIMLPVYPVLEVNSVVEYWGVSGPHVLVESSPTAQVDGWQCTYETGRLTRVFPGNVEKPWFPGARNVEVVWTAGYDPIPPDIKVATLEMVAHWFRNSQQQTAGRGVGPGSDESTAPNMWAGAPYRVETLLNPYRRQGMA